ncbi:MAG: phosphoglycerate kinase, partial [Deltaproteobacteria bacterium]|nr:phosphoglycerate kinase [Deltaproteobacteria bacterium]
MRAIPLVRDLSLSERAVFLRLDLNVPVAAGQVTSDARIRAALPTIEYVLAQGGRVALASHFGRPKGKRDAKYSLEPVGVRLSELLSRDVLLADDCVGDGVKRLMRNLRAGQLILLENLRFHAGEEKNDSQFAKALAAPFEVYVNDAFGASHRAHASMVGMVESFRERAAGFLLMREVEALTRLIEAPARPFVAVVGGAKVSDKVGVLGALLSRTDAILVGGAMAYTLLKATGKSVGQSHIDADKVHVARELLARADARGVRILVPED